MIGAFGYLILHSARNRFITQLRRLRSPRYAIAFLLGVGYFGLVFFNRSGSQGREGTSPIITDTLGALLPFAFLVLVAYTWLAGADRTALAFSTAEVSMLFTAPVSRRQLIVYKIVRSQVTVLTSSLIWVILFGRGHDAVTRALGYWVLFSTLNLHRLGVALVRASGSEHGTKGLRRSVPAFAMVGAILAMILAGLYKARFQFQQAEDLGDMLHVLGSVFSAAPMSWVILPFRAAVAPAISAPGAAWARAMLWALGLLLLHVLWVLRSDAAFEEAAAEASATQARRIEAMRARRLDGGNVNTKAARRTLPLASTGAPAVALVWKNTLWLMRSGQLRTLLGLPIIAILAALAFSGRSSHVEMIIATLCGIVGVMLLLFGPATMRNDMRGDLRRLPMIKTLPLSGQQIILAEVASSAVPTAALQFLLVIAGVIAVSFADEVSVPLPVRFAIIAASPAVLIGLNLANFSIHNAFALLLPGWIRLGETSPGGVEAMGQAMLSSIITMLVLALLLLGPALGVTAVYFLLRQHTVLLVLVGSAVSGAALFFEAYLMTEALGGTLERTEPMHVG
ncbi:MAG: putative ABC exporter domain-containing protein [bacterium]